MAYQKIGIKIFLRYMHLPAEFYGRKKLLLPLFIGLLMKAAR